MPLCLSRSLSAFGVLLGMFLVPTTAVYAQTPALARPTPTLDLTKDHVLYLIGYSHLDTEWCWNYPQVIREFIPNTLRDNFALLDKYPDFIFNWTGANRYRFMKEYYPDDYARLKTYIAAGRWIPAGSSLEEGDVCIPSPESIIRQVLYGNQYFRREFGKASNEYMLPDCFGFPASLPTLLDHAGITGFSTQKLTWGSAVGIPFNIGTWTGPDGSSVLAALNGGAYDKTIREDLSQSQRYNNRLEANGQKTGVYADYIYYGAGDRGGSPGEESVQWLTRSLQGNGPVRVVTTPAGELFSRLTPDLTRRLPDYRGDLLLTQHSAGSATSQAAMKRWNRKNEYLGDAAERASVAAAWLGAKPYDASRLHDAWLRFLPGQFHDIMAGTSLPQSYDYAWNDQIIALNEFADVLQQAVGGVVRGMDTRGAGVPLVVYNPLSLSREDVVEAEVSFPNRVAPPRGVRVIGPDDKAVPAQIVGSGKTPGTLKILFLAQVPSVGFATFHVQPVDTATPVRSVLRVSKNTLENARYRVRLNKEGDVASVYDKAAKQELLSGPARLAFQYEKPANFPAWNMDWKDQQAPPRSYVDGPATIRIVENGPARVALQVERAANGSRFIQTIRLASGGAGNRVEFATKIDWRSQETALKAIFPLAVANPKATYNWGVGTIQRGNNDPRKYEVPSHEWFDVTRPDNRYGVAVLDDSKYGSDKPDDKTVRLTLVYTPGVRGAYQHQGTQDWGQHEMVYALQGHVGDWRQGNTQSEAARLNQPLAVFQTPVHAGSLGRSFSLLTVSSPHVAVAALKKAEDSNEIIVRLFEKNGQAASNVRLAFAAPIVAAREVNGQEQPRKTGAAFVLKQGVLVFDMAAYRPRAFALKLGNASAKMTPPRALPLRLPFNADVMTARAGKTDGAFDRIGRTYPGKLLPTRLDSGGIPFTLGSTRDGAKNAVSCQGQQITLPALGAGSRRRVYLLTAAQGGDTEAAFRVGSKPVTRTIPYWGGFIGQWDYRLWQGKVPELTYSWDNPLDGLQPGYIKRIPVAWYADHWRLPDGKNDPYRFCYLFRCALDVPPGAKTLTLPNNPQIRVFAATLAVNPNDDARPAAPLYDTLEDHMITTPPNVTPAGGTFRDAITVTVQAPLYFNNKGKGDLRYSLDGTEPGPRSPVYNGPVTLTRSATLKVRQIGVTAATSGPTRAVRFTLNDTTPPAVQSVSAIGSGMLRVNFSEPVTKESALNPAHYVLQPAAPVQSARLSADGRSVQLTLAGTLPREGNLALQVRGVRDRSVAGNATAGKSAPVTLLKPVFEAADARTLTGSGPEVTFPNVAALPTKGNAPWTMNLFVYTDNEPDELTILGGFGDGTDTSGTQRYLVKFRGGIHFWGSNVDINAGQPFDEGAWQMVTITYDGSKITLYKNGQKLKEEAATLEDAAPIVKLGPNGPWNPNRFTGKIAGFTIWREALPAEFIQTLLPTGPAPIVPGAAKVNTTPQPSVPTFVSDTHEVPELEAWGHVAQALCQVWYPKIIDFLQIDDAKRRIPRKITIYFKKDMKGVAYASGGNLYIAADWVKAHPDDYGMVIHELTHMVQRYPAYKVVWLVEGIADYVRGYFFEPELTHPRINFARAKYTDSYKTTAAFLKWTSDKYDKNLVQKLSNALIADTYSDDTFRQITGKDAATLWSEFAAANAPSSAPGDTPNTSRTLPAVP